MNRTTICLLIGFLSFTADLSAQKSKVKSIEWHICGQLPPDNGGLLGLAGPVAGVNNDVLVVGGGSNFPDSMPWMGGRKKYYDDLFVFKKDGNDSLVLFRSFRLPFSLAYSANVSTQHGIVIAGGENENGISNKALLLQWDPGTQTIMTKSLPDLPLAVTNASMAVHGAKIYLAGGEMTQAVSDRFLCLDLNDVAGGWKELPALYQAVSHAVLVFQSDGKDDYFYLIGGRKKNADRASYLYAATFQFNLGTNQWKEKKSLPYTLAAGTGMAVGTNTILMFGGDSGGTFHQTEELIFAINSNNDTVKKAQLIKEKIRVQSLHPGFCKQVLLYDTRKDEWKTAGCIPYESPVTTTAVKWNAEILIPAGEIRAGVRTPNILSAKIIF